jgi:hydrocephalus-inducing protein
MSLLILAIGTRYRILEYFAYKCCGDRHFKKVTIENRGEIPTHFALQTNTGGTMCSKFHFDPMVGDLEIGEKRNIQITFDADQLGDFFEEFSWKLQVSSCAKSTIVVTIIRSQGGAEPLLFSIRGHVIGPTFHFDVDKLDFDQISYGFTEERKITLSNTSHIPMTFSLRFASSTNDTGEFSLFPKSGTIPKAAQIEILVKFKPKSVQTYAADLVVDVDSVGLDLFRLPISATSIIPEVIESMLKP